MGAYAQCWLGDFYVSSSKNDIDPGLMALLRGSDKRVVSDPAVKLPHQMEHWADALKDDPTLPIVYYAAPMAVVRDRLNVLGYTLATSRQAFAKYVEAERTQYEEWASKPAENGEAELKASLRDHWKATAALLGNLTVDAWLAGLRQIKQSGLEPNYYGRYEGPHEDTLLGYMLSNEWYGFPGPDRNIALRLSLEVCPEAQELIYDVTDLVWQEYVTLDEDLVEYSLRLSADEHQSTAKIILLTEGKSDSAILKQSLNLLFPHLADYYSFIDFEQARVGGGAGNLANMVKTFSGAGIVNRTIAIFDNDTAAAAALKGLERVALPPHIRVLRLPLMESLRTYPTIGPSGSVLMDVNGVAASLELYLGEDVLYEGDSRIPVQWTGYDAGMRQYQGEVLDKEKIQQRFFDKVQRVRAGGASLDDADWSGLRTILSAVFEAFNDFDSERIRGIVRDINGCQL